MPPSACPPPTHPPSHPPTHLPNRLPGPDPGGTQEWVQLPPSAPTPPYPLPPATYPPTPTQAGGLRRRPGARAAGWFPGSCACHSGGQAALRLRYGCAWVALGACVCVGEGFRAAAPATVENKPHYASLTGAHVFVTLGAHRAAVPCRLGTRCVLLLCAVHRTACAGRLLWSCCGLAWPGSSY